jgi:hypothetical protein
MFGEYWTNCVSPESFLISAEFLTELLFLVRVVIVLQAVGALRRAARSQ